MKAVTSSALMMMLVVATVSADEARVVPREVLDAIVDDDPNPLPRSMTPGERLAPLPVPDLDALMAPPAGSVFTPAEYEHNHGLLISWGSFNSLLTAMTVGITTGDPDAVVYVVVDSASQQASATSVLQDAGADLSQVEFILYDTDSVWIRDYGPRFISEDYQRAMVDHTYNRPWRPRDNAFTDHLTTLWSEAQYDIPLTHGGGNFHLFASGEAFMSDLILDENPGLDAQDVHDYYAQYEGLDVTIFEGFPTWYDSTQHIDMWMLPVGESEIIIGEYAPTDVEPYAITENAVTELTARGYTVHRTPGWNSGGTHYTYTNSVVFNDLVFVCEFSGYPTDNAIAMSTYESAYPGHQIIPVDCSSIIHSAGAVHCIVMHVPEVSNPLPIFADAFESGDTTAWGMTESSPRACK